MAPICHSLFSFSLLHYGLWCFVLLSERPDTSCIILDLQGILLRVKTSFSFYKKILKKNKKTAHKSPEEMDTFVLRNIKAEKSNAWVRYKRIQRLKATFRFLELCVFLIILSRFTIHLPSVFKISGDYFRGLSVTAVNPLFVFLIGNAIVVVLFLKSREQSKDGDRSSNPINDFYEEYAKNRQRNGNAIIKHEIKRVEKKQRSCTSGEGELICQDVAAGTVVKEKKICRSRSENSKRLHHHKESGCREILRRSVTERRQPKSVDTGEEQGKNQCPEDELSNEEFRRTIEAFIARQQRALKEDQDLSSDLSF